MHFMKIAPDVLNILKKLTGLALNLSPKTEKKISIRFQNLRSDTLSYEFYFGDGEYYKFYKDTRFIPVNKNPLVINDEDLIKKLGNTFVILSENGACMTAVTPMLAFKKLKSDITPSGYAVDYYSIDINLTDRSVQVNYYAYKLGPNGSPTYKKEYLRMDEYPWWPRTRTDDEQKIFDKMIPG